MSLSEEVQTLRERATLYYIVFFFIMRARSKLQQTTISFIISVCPPVRISARNN